MGDSVIVGNTAATGGGGICCKAGRLIMDNCDVNNNIAPIGAGLLLESATTWIDYCTIRGNGAGAGLEVLSGNLTMDDCWIEGNQNGGALLDSATTTLSNCWFQNNIAANGGGLTCRYGSLTLTTCDFSANEALGAGGGLYLANADVNVRDCFITANRAGTDGAGVYAAPPANCRMVNCAISGNVSRRQCGGVCVTGVGNCALVNCVLNGNDGGAVGGGLCVTGPVQVRLANSILWGNLAEKAPEIAVGSQQQGLSIRHSDIQGGVAAMLLPAGYNLGLTPGLIDQQPRFMAPGIWDDRGTADPLDDLWTDGDYRLTAASPCIDAGDSRAFPIGSGGGDAAPLPSDPVFDLAGRPRFFDDPSVTDTGVPDPPSPTIDMGPYEFQAAVWGRRAFYNNSRFDDYAVAVDASDDLAIATDKRALLPGQTPTADHYLSYARGLNGIMIDIPEVPVDQPAPRDFVFTLLGREGKTSQTAPAPSFIGLRRRAGANGADRITLAWADNAIPNANWLKVEVKSDANGGRLGLPLDDTFYFGLAIGDTRTPFGISVVVNATDMLAIRNHPWDAQDPAPIDNPYDVNRDGLVDRADERVAQKAANTTFTCLRLVPLP